LTYKNGNLNYKFGLYAGNEAYGLYLTPLLGIYYKSPNNAFEFTALIPGLMLILVLPHTRIGLDYKGILKLLNNYNENSDVNLH
jgi:hypothetical protein